MQDVENLTPPRVPEGETGQWPFRDEDGEINREFLRAVGGSDRRVATRARLLHLVEDFHESEMGDLLEALDTDHRPRLIELLGSDFDFAALTEVDDSVREEILEELETSTVAEGVRDLESDDAVTILESLDDEDKADVLDRLPAIERVALQRSLDYPEDSAGRRMQTEFIAVPPFWTVGQTIDFMRETPDLPETFYEIFVIDPAGHLLGAVALDRLLRSKRPITIEQLMDDEPDRVKATENQEEVARMFERYNLVSAAVVDEADRLVGVMMVDDIVDVLEEEADADIKQLGGVHSDEELSDTVMTDPAQPLPLAVRQHVHGHRRRQRDRRLLGLARAHGGARGADADRRLHGRQCRHPDHDGRRARARDPRTRPLERLADHPARGHGRPAERRRVRGHHGDDRRPLVPGLRSRRGDGAGADHRPALRGAWAESSCP